MKKLISLILMLCLSLVLFACDEDDSTNSKGSSETDPRFYVPTEQKMFSEDGELLFTRTFEFDENGFMSKVDTVYSGFRYENRHETINFKNDFDKKAMKLTQNITFTLEGNDNVSTLKYVWTFDSELNIVGVSYFSQGSEWKEEISIEINDLIWLNDDGSFPSIEGGEYPIPTVSLPRNEDSGLPRRLVIGYSEGALTDNAYATKIKADLASQYGEELVEYADIEKYVAYHTLWGAISRKDGNDVITELKYDNGTVAECIKWKNATTEQFVSLLTFDWDWFGGGVLDFTTFRYACTLDPPYKPAY